MIDTVLAGLTKRRAELSGEADRLHARLAQIATDTGHLDAVIRQFDPDYDLGSIRPKRPHGPDVTRPGEMSRFMLCVLRDAAEPVPTSDIAIRLMMERSMNGQRCKLVKQITKRIVLTPRHQGQKGMGQSYQGPRWVLLWEVVR